MSAAKQRAEISSVLWSK